MMDCNHFKELVGLLALGALDGEERAAAEAHLALPHHEGCIEALDAAMQSASALDGDGEHAAIPSTVLRSVMRQVEPAAARLQVARRRGVTGWALAAAALLALVFVASRGPRREDLDTALRDARDKGGALTAAVAERDSCQKRNATLEAERRNRTEAIALLQLAGTRLYPLAAEKGRTATANAILHTGVKRAYVLAEGLPPVAEHDYELWVARGKRVVPAGLLQVDEAGHSVVRVDYEALLGEAGVPDAMMITLEPAGGGDTVRGPTIVIGTLHS